MESGRPGASLAGRGEMAERIRSCDWAATSLGPIESWPTRLTASLGLILGAQMPMWLGWGPECLFFYNDAYVHVLGRAKHPWALGQPAAVVWAEIWDVCGPLAERVYRDGDAPFVEDVRLFMNRGTRLEEVYYSFSYSPIRDDAGEVVGLFCPNTEVTAKILGTRRLRTMSELAASALVEKTRDAACTSAAEALARNPDDLPFALLYVDDGVSLSLSQAVNVVAGSELTPLVVDELHDPWRLTAAVQTGRALVTPVPANAIIPRGLADQPIAQAIAVPLTAAGHGRPLGALVAGINPTRELDADYRTFYELVSAQIGAAIQNAVVAEEERRRVETLAELDRAKTAFFSNVSHEFRTPLTLMIGPTEDALATPARALTGEALEGVYRNELRLLKLVTALLDFSRIEAGRMTAEYEAVDLAVLTADLASTFRSAIERAGLRYVVDTPSLGMQLAVDPAMWEKIVLNLVSNAFKFTLRGTITVTLRREGDLVALEVADTGAGIPAAELPRLFQRFHRIQTPAARSHEGTGIGLALVHELVHLHDGTITVDSELGQGTRFTVRIPVRTVTSPVGARERSSGTWRAAYVGDEGRIESGEPGAAADGCVLLADDNADMRAYVTRLLSPHWKVVAVANGREAVAAAVRELPDLVLTDVMMPELDGFGVLAALRADERTRAIPVIMLSARAGDEARVDGLEAGADDYLVKPFAARELIARVRTHVALARLRAEAERRYAQAFALFMQLPAHVTVRLGPELRCVFQNAASLQYGDLRGTTLRQAWTDPDVPWARAMEQAMRTGSVVVERGSSYRRAWRTGEEPSTKTWDFTYAPLRLPDGTVDGVVTLAIDVTAQREAAEARELAEGRLRAALAAAAVGTYVWDLNSGTVEADEGVRRAFGLAAGQGAALDDYAARVHPEDRGRWDAARARCAAERIDFDLEYRVVHPDGSIHWLVDRGALAVDGAAPPALTGAVVDISEPRRLAVAAEAASRSKDEFLAVLGHELRNPLAPILTALQLLEAKGLAGTREVETIARQVEHLRRLVDDLLDVSRITQGHVELRRERLELAAVLGRAIELASPLLERYRHQLTVDVPAGIAVDGDPVRLAQVFSNLLTNAARYTAPGGHIAIHASTREGSVRVDVSDDGAGIDGDQLERIFELFARGQTQDHAVGHGGLGVGLSLVRALTRLHGGTVVAASDGRGRGSTFTVTLPLARALAAPAVQPAPSASSRTRPRAVMLVDDNRDAADLLGEVLRLRGHHVEIAYDGPGALQLARGFAPEVAVIDIGLPVMDGYELAEHLREHGLAACRFIALTGFGQEHDRAKSAAAGFAGHLVKPVVLDKLLAAVDEA